MQLDIVREGDLFVIDTIGEPDPTFPFAFPLWANGADHAAAILRDILAALPAE